MKQKNIKNVKNYKKWKKGLFWHVLRKKFFLQTHTNQKIEKNLCGKVIRKKMQKKLKKKKIKKLGGTCL